MADQQLLAQRFEEQRTHLRAVAYRMLGSLTEADDAVQEAWLRLSRADTDDVTNLAAWLITVTGRICLDMLRSRTARREEPLDVRLPDPVKPGGSRSTRWSTARRAWSPGGTAGWWRCSGSRSRTTRSSRSTCWPTRSG